MSTEHHHQPALPREVLFSSFPLFLKVLLGTLIDVALGGWIIYNITPASIANAYLDLFLHSPIWLGLAATAIMSWVLMITASNVTGRSTTEKEMTEDMLDRLDESDGLVEAIREATFHFFKLQMAVTYKTLVIFAAVFAGVILTQVSPVLGAALAAAYPVIDFEIFRDSSWMLSPASIVTLLFSVPLYLATLAAVLVLSVIAAMVAVLLVTKDLIRELDFGLELVRAIGDKFLHVVKLSRKKFPGLRTIARTVQPDKESIPLTVTRLGKTAHSRL